MIRNRSRDTLISKEKRFMVSKREQGRGLMFKRKPETLVFDLKKKKKVGLHMFFVFFPIDVLFLDEDKKITAKIENFLPWRICKAREGRFIIELPAGTIRKTNSHIGDTLEF